MKSGTEGRSHRLVKRERERRRRVCHGLIFAGMNLRKRRLAGYLVTRPEPSYYPAAWVPGTSLRSLATAVRIAADYGLAAELGGGVVDLREYGVRSDRKPYPDWFENLFLLRVNASGCTEAYENLRPLAGVYNLLLTGNRKSLLFAGAPFPIREHIDRVMELLPRVNPRAEAAQRRRRRPGEAWDLWQVRLQGTVPLGYLVTTRDSAPWPIAFVRGICRESLKLALAVLDTGQIRHAAVMDLRSRSLSGEGKPLLPKSLFKSLLMPVDRLGRIITTDSTFAAGQYQRPKRMFGQVYTFMMLTHAGLGDRVKVGPFPIKKPQSAMPIAPKPASIKSDETVTVAAA